MPTAVLSAFAATSVFCSGMAGAAVVYNEPTTYFDIGASGVRGQDIWNAIRRWGPTSSLSSRRITAGTTTGSYSYRFDKVSTRNGCSVKNFKITVTAKILLPSWDKSFRAPPESQRYWQCLETIVNDHEKRHGQIWREAAETIDQTIAGLPSELDCDMLSTTVKRIATDEWNDGDRRQAEFDRDEYAANRFEGCNKELISTDQKRTKAADAQSEEASTKTKTVASHEALNAAARAAEAAALTSENQSDLIQASYPANALGAKSVSTSKAAIIASSVFIALLLGAALAFYRWLSNQYRETGDDPSDNQGGQQIGL